MLFRHRVTVARAIMKLTIPKKATGSSDELMKGRVIDTLGPVPVLSVSNQHSW